MGKRVSIKEVIAEEAAAELHAATLAVLLHLKHPEVREATTAYWTRVLSRYHAVPDIQERVEAYLADVEARAARQASELEEGIYAERLGQVGRCTAGSPTPGDGLEGEGALVLAF